MCYNLVRNNKERYGDCMATAKEQAQTNLGPIKDYVNYSGYETERTLANDMYNNTLQTMKNEYDTLMNTLNQNRQQLNKDFSSGRAGVSDDYYNQQRLLSGTNRSRVLKGTGLANLGQAVNRMKVGNELSNLANTYYNGVDENDANIKAGQLAYDINKRVAENTYNATLADIDARRKGSENDYNSKVAQLAEQIQSRWDSNRNAQAQLELQRSSLAQQVKQYEDTLKQQLDARLQNLAGKEPTAESYKKAFEYYKDYNGGTDADVYNYLRSIGVNMPQEKELNDVVVEGDNVYRTGKTVPFNSVSQEEYNKMSKLQKWWFDFWGGQKY